MSPKGGAVIGPFKGTEFYVNAGLGFHSNDARGATITVDPATGDPAERVTPLARATGAEVGFRSVRIPHLQTSVSLWTLRLDSELVFIGDAGNTEAGRPSHRYGVELANYYAPRPWLMFDADVSVSRAHFTDDDPAGDLVPGAVKTVLSGGVTLDSRRHVFGSVRWRYFGPAAAARRRLGAVEGHEPGEPRGGLSLDQHRAAGRGRVQPVRRQPQRHRLLLHVASAGRTGRRRGRLSISTRRLPRSARLSLVVGF